MEPTRALVSSMPPGFDAAVFVVLHTSPDFPSLLPQILSRSGALPASHATDGELIESGRILVAPPDHHLSIEDGRVRVTRGPRENRHRPAIDPLFRTAARTYESRVIGVVLSGYLDDGAAGLRAIRARGGIGIVQDPEDATARQMPDSAIAYGGADYVLNRYQIGARLVQLVNSTAETTREAKKVVITPSGQNGDVNLHTSKPGEGSGVPSPFSCPECGGVLWESKDEGTLSFRCRVGHAYSVASLVADQERGVEDALWAAMRALEEKAALATRMSESTGDHRSFERLREQAQSDRDYAETIRSILFTNEKEAKSAD
jgi:two-component system, chemotaxis family, protein-glutamate methylesterase/glutaminase